MIPTRYLELLDALELAAIGTDPAGLILEWNPAAERLYGWLRSEALGRNVVDVTPAMMSRETAAEIMQALGAGTIWSGEFPVRTRQGKSFVASVTDVPVVRDGTVAAIIGVSAPSSGPASLRPSVVRFAAGCDMVWRDHVELKFGYGDATVPASEPHLLQLLSLIAIRYVGELDRGAPLQIEVQPAEESLLSGFGVPRVPTVHILVGTTRSAVGTLLRDEISSAQPANFAAALTRILGGWLFAESSGATHLLVPVQN